MNPFEQYFSLTQPIEENPHKVLMDYIKNGKYKAFIIIYPFFNIQSEDQQFIDTLRFGLNTVGGFKTRCLIGRKDAEPKARQIMGKKGPYVKIRTVHQKHLDEFIEVFSNKGNIILMPSELTLKELDQQYCENGCNELDSESIKDFMKFWHYKPPVKATLNVTKIMFERNEIPLSNYSLSLWDEDLYNKCETLLHQRRIPKGSLNY